jgi:hypothetical protein
MSQATDMLALYLAAEQDILQHGKTTRLGDQEKTVSDLPQIRQGRKEWERRVAAETAADKNCGGPAVASFVG